MTTTRTRYSTNQAAKILGVHRNTLLRWIQDGTAFPARQGLGPTGPIEWTEPGIRKTAIAHDRIPDWTHLTP